MYHSTSTSYIIIHQNCAFQYLSKWVSLMQGLTLSTLSYIGGGWALT